MDAMPDELAAQARLLLAAAMETTGFSSREIARRNGMSNSTMSKILLGRAVPSFSTYDKIMRAMGLRVTLSVTSLLDTDPTATPETTAHE